jgi:hypothetical protein
MPNLNRTVASENKHTADDHDFPFTRSYRALYTNST